MLTNQLIRDEVLPVMYSNIMFKHLSIPYFANFVDVLTPKTQSLVRYIHVPTNPEMVEDATRLRNTLLTLPNLVEITFSCYEMPAGPGSEDST